ncbi:putative DUF26 domain-containing protein 1 precursor [Tripterygium wilfordii]|uniref:Putative DUF26 domain-containing protein 1 n=1 Tax=Tripterygium wilfordii TaxID=458696 RepID=A0A7J7CUX5_TRIWF|nr:plasmodesmata-located protein 6-like [Tripterygium wilfordii]KAF5737759.1 putative DUF26 domain-containing protein 1 precursor [Tripterygium wilfordii]
MTAEFLTYFIFKANLFLDLLLPSHSADTPPTIISISSTMSAVTLFLLFLVFTLTIHTKPSNSALDSFVYGGCSQLKFTPNSPYENNLNSLLTSLVNSATFTTYNNFTIQSPSSQDNTLYGLFQCRGDINGGDCSRCVARAVTQLGTLCLDSTGGVLQLDGCLVKYDNATFLGVEDGTVALKKCGPSIEYDSDSLTRRDALLDYLAAVDGSYKPYRTGGSGDMYGYAQCVGDLSGSECQDCLSEAIQRLKTDCGPTAAGDMYLGKCYVRFSKGGAHSHGGNDKNHNDDEIEKTLAILIGLVAGVALLIMFLSLLIKFCGKGRKR